MRVWADAQQVNRPNGTNNRPAEFPLSYAQQVSFIQAKERGDVAISNYQLPILIDGVIHEDTLQSALDDVIERHEILRTVFVERDGSLRQCVVPYRECRGHVRIHLSSSLEELAKGGSHSFDLRSEIPIQARLVSTSSTQHILLLVLHPLAMDAWSLRPLLHDLSTAYGARTQGKEHPLSRSLWQYADYTMWQRQIMENALNSNSLYARELAFWTSTLALMPRHIYLPQDYPSQESALYRKGVVYFRLNPSLHGDILNFMRGSNVGSTVILHAGLITLLSRIGAGSDLPLVTAVSGRHQGALYHSIGPFAKSLIVRTDTSGNPSFRDLVRRVHRAYAHAYHNQDVPLGMVPGIVASGSPFPCSRPAQVMLTVRSASHELTVELPDVRFLLKSHPINIGGFDVGFDVLERRGPSGLPEGIEGGIEYNCNLFKRCSIERLLSQFVSILRSAVEMPDQQIKQLAMERTGRVLIEGRWDNRPRLYEEASAVHRTLRISVSSEAETKASSHSKRRRSRPDGRQLYVAPNNPTQYQLVRIWEKLLGVRRIGIWDEFADLGADSLLFKAMLDEIYDFFGQSLPLSVCASATTVASLSEELVRRLPQSSILAVRSGDAALRPKFFFLHGDLNGGGYYALDLARYLSVHQPLYILQPHGVNGQDVPDSLEEMAEDYIRALRRFQPKGPYYLGGYCNGGLVAFEIARRLQMEHQKIGILVLIRSAFHATNPNMPAVLAPGSKRSSSAAVQEASLFSRHMSAAVRYAPKWYPGNMTLLWPQQDRVSESPLLCWKKVCASVELRWIAGTHHTCLTECIAGLGAELEGHLSQAIFPIPK